MVWLIGCKGMLGSEIARQLNNNNIDFVGTDIDVDITQLEKLESFANQYKNIDWIINCSAYTAVDKAEDDKDFADLLNNIGPKNIATVAKNINAKMIHISTDYVFDGTGTNPYTEDMDVIAEAIALLINDVEANKEKAMNMVKELTDKYPLY